MVLTNLESEGLLIWSEITVTSVSQAKIWGIREAETKIWPSFCRPYRHAGKAVYVPSGARGRWHNTGKGCLLIDWEATVNKFALPALVSPHGCPGRSLHACHLGRGWYFSAAVGFSGGASPGDSSRSA